MKHKFIFQTLFAAVLALGFAACGGSTGPHKGDKNWVDYSHNGSVQLNLDYKNRDFYGYFTRNTYWKKFGLI